jgi:hypothetical protein
MAKVKMKDFSEYMYKELAAYGYAASETEAKHTAYIALQYLKETAAYEIIDDRKKELN